MLRYANAPTIRPASNFNAREDAKQLNTAIQNAGTGGFLEKSVMDILCKRSSDQRNQIERNYKELYNRELAKDLVEKLEGNLEDFIVALLYSSDEFDAVEMNKAMKGLGTNEAVLIEILASRSNAEINACKAAYKRLYQQDLEYNVVIETTGDFQVLLGNLVKGNRDETNRTNHADAVLKANKLYEAGVKKFGTDESVFNEIISKENYAQLNLIFEEYRKLTKHDIEHAIDQEFSGDIKQGLLAVVKCARCKAAYFANVLNKALHGSKCDHKTLIRVLVSRCDKDLATIKQEYQRQYANSLEAAIDGDTTGKYKDAMLLLLGA